MMVKLGHFHFLSLFGLHASASIRFINRNTKRKSYKELNMDICLKQFLDVWQPYQKELFSYVDCDLDKFLDNHCTSLGTTQLVEVKKRKELIFELCKQVQCKLLDIGENNLVITPMYHWNELLVKYPKINQIGFQTPFSFLSHWLSLHHLAQLTKEDGFREALLLVDRYIALLEYKFEQKALRATRHAQLAVEC